MPADPLALLRSRSYLVLAALIGAPISAAAYFFLALAEEEPGPEDYFKPADFPLRRPPGARSFLPRARELIPCG